MEKKLTNSAPLRELADKHSIYAIKKGSALLCIANSSTCRADP
jgi:hypothetical protein